MFGVGFYVDNHYLFIGGLLQKLSVLTFWVHMSIVVYPLLHQVMLHVLASPTCEEWTFPFLSFRLEESILIFVILGNG